MPPHTQHHHSQPRTLPRQVERARVLALCLFMVMYLFVDFVLRLLFFFLP